MRLVFLCHDVAVIDALVNREAALKAVSARSGGAYEPALAEAFLADAGALMSVLDSADATAAVLAEEPVPDHVLSASELDDVCLVLADFTDLQLPKAISHSRTVATLAEAAAKAMGQRAGNPEVIRRAALLHDLGYAALPVRSRGGYRDTMHASGDVKLHPYHGEEIVGRVPALGDEAMLIGRHHETTNGQGYFRGLSGAALPPAARILAAAELYQSLLEGRSGAAGLDAAAAASRLKAEVAAGRLDGEAAKAVLAAAGHRVAIKRTGLVAGLTHRELEILRLAATGLSMKEIGQALGISPKTVDNHLQSLYSKIEVKTRAGATLFAIENGICSLPN